jgi:hypothetical protein
MRAIQRQSSFQGAQADRLQHRVMQLTVLRYGIAR